MTKSFSEKFRLQALLTGIFFAAIQSGCQRSATVGFDDIGTAAADLPHQIARYKALGLPWTVSEALSKPNFPDEDNAAIYLTSASQELSSTDPPASHKYIPKSSTPLAELRRPKWSHSKSRIESVTQFAILAAGKPYLFYWRNLDDSLGYNASAPISEIKVGVDTLLYNAESAARTNDADRAARYFEKAESLIQAGFHSSLTFGDLALVGTVSHLCDIFEYCLYDLWSNRPALVRFLDQVKLRDLEFNAPAKLRTEIYQQLVTIRDYDPDPVLLRRANLADQQFNDYLQTRANVVDGIPGSLRQRAYLARALRYWSDVQDEIRKEGAKAPVYKIVDEVAKRYSFEKNPGYSYAVLQTTMYDHATVTRFENLANSRLRAEHLLASATEYRIRKGAWPSDASQLPRQTDAVGKPFYIQSSPNQFVIYSLEGEDAKPTKEYLLSASHPHAPNVSVAAAFFPPPKTEYPLEMG